MGPNCHGLVIAQRSSTVREQEHAKAGDFELHLRVDERAFVLGQGRRDDGAVSVVVVGGDGGAQCNVHRAR